MTRIRVKLFAFLKDAAGRSEMTVNFGTEPVSCEDVLSFLAVLFEEAKPMLGQSLVAVNGQFASRDLRLSSGDEVAILPPVSGG